jgi:pilus assembly protein CpaE
VPRERGRVIAVYSARRGTRSTSVSRNLAVAFATLRPPDSVVLAELDPRARRERATSPAKSIEAVAGDGRMRLAAVASPLIRRPSGEWAFLRGWASPEAPALDAKTVSQLVEELQPQFERVVLDLEYHMNERTLAALDAADRVVLLTQLSVASIRGTQRAIQLCRRLGYTDDKMCLVITRYRADAVISPADVTDILRREAFHRLPDDPNAFDAMSRGLALTDEYPDGPLAESFRELALRLDDSLESARSPQP